MRRDEDYRRVPLFWHLGDLVLYTFFMPEFRIATVDRGLWHPPPPR
jgi:hypothetical protein